MVRNHQDAEDLTQDTFIKAYKNLVKLKDVPAFKAWLYQIAYTTTMNYLKKQRIKSLNLFVDPEKVNQISMQVTYHSDEYGEKATKIFATLTHKEHTLLTLRAIEEMSYQELSQVMGKSPEVLRKRYERLIIKLKKTFPSTEEV
jgi:RNA polymerase sigma-70 factor (ECF subfamily)